MINLDNSVLILKEEVTNIRRELHRIPEFGFEEYKTSEFIAFKLKEYGIEVVSNIAKTGVVGLIKGYEGKKTLAYRADMDALSVEEKTGLDFSSTHRGMMHACGHDGHMAMLLGFAKYLSGQREKLKDNIILLFQPAEEGPGGAEPMIKEGIIKRFQIDRIFGLHLYPDVEEGKIGCRPGPLMAQNAEFNIVVKGQSGHGAIPNKAIDSILISANLITSYQSIISRSIDPNEGAVITVGKMWAGEARNIIAGETFLEGTIRAFNEETYNRIKSRMMEIGKGLELMHNCEIDIDIRDMYPAVNNDKEMYCELVNAIGMENMEEVKPQMTSEDFAYYQKQVPGLFFFIGVKNEKEGYKYPLHNCRFDFNEKNLLIGIQVYANILMHIKGLDK